MSSVKSLHVEAEPPPAAAEAPNVYPSRARTEDVSRMMGGGAKGRCPSSTDVLGGDLIYTSGGVEKTEAHKLIVRPGWRG